MSGEPQLFRVNPGSTASERIEEVDFSQLGLRERRDIQEWVAANPSILGDDLLVVGKEFSGFDRTDERLDLLAVDRDGKLVIIELKRDDTGADAHWQAIKYASYLHRATPEHIVAMLASHLNVLEAEAEKRLLEHLEADDFTALNNSQRIVLASHRFAPEVTSASLWLNAQASGDNLITCVTLTPFRDVATSSLYIQATTIIPVSGVEEYVINIGSKSPGRPTEGGNSLGDKLRTRFQRNRTDDVNSFVGKVRASTLKALSGNVRPDKTGKWAGGWEHFRYYNFWYRRDPWANHRLCYGVHLQPQDGQWHAAVLFKDQDRKVLPFLGDINLPENGKVESEGVSVSVGVDAFSEEFANRIAEILSAFIEQITPIVDGIADRDNEEEVP